MLVETAAQHHWSCSWCWTAKFRRTHVGGAARTTGARSRVAAASGTRVRSITPSISRLVGEEQELRELRCGEVVVAHEQERAQATAQARPERHALDVVERMPERVQVQEQRLLGRLDPEHAGDAAEAADVVCAVQV